MSGNLLLIPDLESFFDKTIHLKNFQESTIAYLVNLFKTAKKQDYSKDSLTLIYSRAKFEQNFNLFQNLGDWILFTETLYPEHLNKASKEYYEILAQNSYYTCYRMLNRQWRLYEELADTFPRLIILLRNSFLSLQPE